VHRGQAKMNCTGNVQTHIQKLQCTVIESVRLSRLSQQQNFDIIRPDKTRHVATSLWLFVRSQIQHYIRQVNGVKLADII